MEFIFHKVQREGHLLVFEVGLQRDLLVCRQACQQVTDLRSAIDQKAGRHIPLIQLRNVLHGPDEVQLILGQEGVTLHGVLEMIVRFHW
ncbi:hypothetical protein ALQ97_200180 [Pseudomonas savastanoi pv. glycinea]|nr:hypothetical protein ALQ97_200180 [Pseudomonas savastanoi pv. glycinea]